ncbi:MAG: hypothetical protein F4058_05265 [Rhodothermaceae bacterium]|nr:hypothetical protein [Rhodothermaceae bacterium]MYI84732.1 hypothetical protein [Rhodothermaceae bacterium]
MSNGLSQHEAVLLTGEESFHAHKVMPSLQLIDFWRWSGSMLSDNTTRGVLGEFLVAAALGLHEKIRRAWDECDIRMPPNTSIEVKSAAYYQAWKQDKPSTIQFGIEPHGSWNAETEEFIEEKKRWADIYVFCVFEGENALDCLDTNKWDFYVIATRVLDQEVPQQKTIGLRSLIKLSPHKCSFEDLQKVILDVEKEIKENLPSSL